MNWNIASWNSQAQRNHAFSHRAANVLGRITFNGWRYVVVMWGQHAGDSPEQNWSNTTFALRIEVDEGVCNVTGETLKWNSRKWLLSPHMTDGEIIQTAFLATMTAMEHETREQFKYRGATIFDPHYDLEKLVALRTSPDATVERSPPRPLGEILGPTENVGSTVGWPHDPNAPKPQRMSMVEPVGSSFGV